MSKHYVTTPKFNISFGVDSQSPHVFAAIFLNEVPEGVEDDIDLAFNIAPGFNPFSSYPVSSIGIRDAIKAVESYIRADGEPNFKVPSTLVPELLNEVNIHWANPQASLNFTRNHGFVEF